ncbi:hypothetical protein ANACAC_00260 [Anaerostipes caccae L1-92]|uniref:Uncharacterized protein n=1 Tax=Anaerostipes caccae (strain DSM 14662 / CCUG 47493 / JCM 13470 / NCIMB 13811 / L1-92) TaxID=411490 RepID=B0M9N8_ANACD|nr:hypothetical protein ANACAC_00260 [Anaerostipes caccae L1-92]
MLFICSICNITIIFLSVNSSNKCSQFFHKIRMPTGHTVFHTLRVIRYAVNKQRLRSLSAPEPLNRIIFLFPSQNDALCFNAASSGRYCIHFLHDWSEAF